jgi:hypothetical protein
MDGKKTRKKIAKKKASTKKVSAKKVSAKKVTTKKKASKRRTSKVCNRCGADCALNARACKACNSTRFAPDWVVAKRPVNRQVSVEVTTSNPQYGESAQRLTLSKWWPGGRATFHFPNLGQWEQVEQIINDELAPLIGWKKADQIIEDIKAKKGGGKAAAAGMDYKALMDAHPDFLKKLVAAIDPENISRKEFDNVVEIFGDISDALTNANAGFREAFLAVVGKLPKQKQRALEDLALLLQGWSLQVVTNVAQQVKARMETIELFEKQIQDEKTFEILGDNSIHRILERAMWLIDERYWLLQSNNTLRKFIGDALSKKDKKKYGAKRPDFVCGTVENKLIILELKRPSHTLTVDDLNQLETYTVIAEDHKNFSSYEGYLIGTKEDDELRRYLRRRSGFKVLHYADIIERTMTRYGDFLKAIENA